MVRFAGGLPCLGTEASTLPKCTSIWTALEINSFETREPIHRIDIQAAGTYSISVVNFDKDHYGSVAAGVSIVVTQLNVKPPIPSPYKTDAVRQVGFLVRLLMNPPGVKNIKALIVKYSLGTYGQTVALTTITEKNWGTSKSLGVTLTTPAPQVENLPVEATGIIEHKGRYRLFARYINTLERVSDIVELGYFNFNGTETKTLTYEQFPAWAGTRRNCAVWPFDTTHLLIPGPKSLTIWYDAWNSKYGWLFGKAARSGVAFSHTDSSYYRSPELDLGQLYARINVWMTHTSWEHQGDTSKSKEIVQYNTYGANQPMTDLTSMTPMKQETTRTELTNTRYLVFELWFKDWNNKALNGFSAEVIIL